MGQRRDGRSVNFFDVQKWTTKDGCGAGTPQPQMSTTVTTSQEEQLRTGRIVRCLCAATIAVAASLGLAIPAQAFIQSWNDYASYRASWDFVNSTSRVEVGGMACSAARASAFDIQLVRTAGSVNIFTTSIRAANDNWWWIDSHSAVYGTSYYLRWRGFRWDDANSRYVQDVAPCQGVQARSI